MKHVCVQTWFKSLNFGTTLQAYALSRVLRSLGYIVSFADDSHEGFRALRQLKSRISRIIHSEPSWLHAREKVVANWCKNNFTTCPIHSQAETSDVVKETDCFISGSDQIWNTHFSFNPKMFLSFAGNKKRISYASSIGTKTICPKHAAEINKLLSRYCHISVREETGAQALRSLTGRTDIVQMPDPTMLLTPNEWLTIRSNSENTNITEPYALCYLLGTNLQYPSLVHEIMSLHRLSKLVLIPSLENPTLLVPGADVISSIDATQFVQLISNASIICTDSFHATVLSVILKKPFVEFLRFNDNDAASQNSRIFDLLNHLNLASQILSPTHIPSAFNLDFEESSRIIEEDKLRGINFLINAIEN